MAVRYLTGRWASEKFLAPVLALKTFALEKKNAKKAGYQSSTFSFFFLFSFNNFDLVLEIRRLFLQLLFHL